MTLSPKTGLPKKGEKVRWGTSQGPTEGTVKAILTSTTKVKGYVAKATKEHPEVLVESSKSGKQAIHRPAALKRT